MASVLQQTKMGAARHGRHAAHCRSRRPSPYSGKPTFASAVFPAPVTSHWWCLRPSFECLGTHSCLSRVREADIRELRGKRETRHSKLFVGREPLVPLMRGEHHCGRTRRPCRYAALRPSLGFDSVLAASAQRGRHGLRLQFPRMSSQRVRRQFAEAVLVGARKFAEVPEAPVERLGRHRR